MDCFEKTRATLKVTLTHHGRSGTETKFKFFIDDTAADDKVTISNQTSVDKPPEAKEISATIDELPAVPDTKQSYILRYEAALLENGKEQDKVIGNVTVWMHKVTFTPRCPDTSITQPFEISVMQGGTEKKKVPAEIGKASEFTLAEMAPFTINVASPYTIEAISGKDTGRVQEANFKKTPWTAAFIYPTPAFETPTDSQWQKQYVNIAVGRTVLTDAVQCGHTLEVKVGPRSGTTALAGDKVYMTVVFKAENQTRADKVTTDNKWDKKDWFKPGLTIGTTEKAAETDKVTFKGDVALAGSSPTASFKVELGHAGGDRCTIKIGSTNECKDATLQIENWRRIDYQLSCAKGMTAPATTNAENVYKKVFVDLNKFESLEIPEDEAKVGKNSWFAGSDFSSAAPAKVLVIGYQNMAKIKALMKTTHSPTGTHVVLMHYQIDASSQSGVPKVAALSVPVTEKIKFPPTAATADAWGVTLTAAGPVYPKSLADGEDAVKEAQWKKTGGAWTDIPRDHILLGKKDYADKIHIKLPTAAAAAKDSSEGVEIKVKYHYASTEYNGFADGGHSFTNAYRPGDSDGGVKGVNGTIAHEIGHLIAQAPRSRAVPAGLTHANGTITRTYRHQGDHCADGASDTAYTPVKDLESAGGHPGPSSSCKCIMYGVGTDERNADPKFCTRCEPFVKIEKILGF